MHFDLLTLWFLVMATLVVGSGMTLWERQAHPRRARGLGLLSAGYGTLAVGCAISLLRMMVPGVLGAALGNLVIVAGYLLVLGGLASINGRSYRTSSVALLIVLAATWAVGGPRWPIGLWNYVAAVPIALACAAMTWELSRGPTLRRLRSRPVVMMLTGVHAGFYVGRAGLLPLLALYWGAPVVMLVAKITMVEGLLFAVGLPMAALTLVREDAHGQLLRASRTDFLTGLGNRQWFFEEGARLMRGREAGRLSLLAFDLDRFKAINDRHGHASGDLVLSAFARIAGEAVPPGTLLARIGGEEFAALLPGHDRAEARVIGQLVADRLAAAAIGSEDGASIAATVSIGVAQAGRGAEDLAQLLSAADTALYAAKALGRNRIEFAPARLRDTAPLRAVQIG